MATAKSKTSKSILVRQPGGKRVMLRDGVVAAFFMPAPIDGVVKEMTEAMHAYLGMIPNDALRWESIGANSEEWRRFSKTTIKRCVAQLAPAAAKKRPMTSLALQSGDEGGDAPEYRLQILGNNATKAYLPVFELYFPATVLGDPDEIARQVAALADILPFEYGYASPVLAAGPLFETDAMRQARKYAVRHPGYDVEINRIARWDIQGLVRNAYWLNFLGPGLLKKLGGSKPFSAKLASPITAQPVGRGLMVRAGREPEIGDLDKKIFTANLPKLGKLLEPVFKTDQSELVGAGFAEDNDDDWFQKWLRRFID